jgi:hypothetical protein
MYILKTVVKLCEPLVLSAYTLIGISSDLQHVEPPAANRVT